MYSNITKKFCGVVFSSLLAIGSSNGFAQGLPQSTFTTGDLCDVKNPAAKDIRRDLGGLMNIRTSGNFNVSCPLTLVVGAASYWVGATLTNFHENGETQRFRCTLSEYDVTGFRVNQYSRAIDVDSGFVSVIAFEDVILDDFTNRLQMICSLPPRSQIGLVGIDHNL